MNTSPSDARSPRRVAARRGQTLTGLVAGMVAAAILTLLAGVVLVSAYRSWRTSAAAVEIQRDGMFAVDLLSRALRPVSSNSVTVSNGVLRIQAGMMIEKSFVVDGTSLVYDPDTAVLGNEIVVVGGRLYAFSASNVLDGMAVRLELRDGAEKSEFATTVTFRN